MAGTAAGSGLGLQQPPSRHSNNNGGTGGRSGAEGRGSGGRSCDGDQAALASRGSSRGGSGSSGASDSTDLPEEHSSSDGRGGSSDAGAHNSGSGELSSNCSECSASTCGHEPEQMHVLCSHSAMHMLVLELLMSLITTPQGLLEPAYLPKDHTDMWLQDVVLTLQRHLCRTSNQAVVLSLYQRAIPLPSSAPRALTAALASNGGSSTGRPGLLRLLKLTAPCLFNSRRVVRRGDTIRGGAHGSIEAGTWLTDAGEALPVVIKFIEVAGDAGCYTQSFVDTFNEVTVLEAARAARLPHVAALLDYGLVRGGVQGLRRFSLLFRHYACSLWDWRSRQARGLDPGRLPAYLDVFEQLLDAVAGLQLVNAVHYDIKSANVLLDMEEHVEERVAQQQLALDHQHPQLQQQQPHCGQQQQQQALQHAARLEARVPFRVVLADTGQALVFPSADVAFVQSQRGSVLYASPEALQQQSGQHNRSSDRHDRRRHRGAGFAHDVWSCGCVLFELCTGRPLFGGEACPEARIVLDSAPLLTAADYADLAGHTGVTSLLEFILVRDPSKRPGVAQVRARVGQLKAQLLGEA